MKVRVKDERCVGHGMCNLAAPDVFHLSDEDGHAYVNARTVPAERADAVAAAQRSCPEDAIEITPG